MSKKINYKENWVQPPGEDEFWWYVEARTNKCEEMARWPAVGKHPAGAKKELLSSFGPEIEVVEWGMTYRNRD